MLANTHTVHVIKDAELRIKNSLVSSLNSTLVAYLVLLVLLAVLAVMMPGR